MNCSIFEDSIVDIAREVPLPLATEAVLRSHLQICEPCRARLQRERELTRWFQAIAREGANQNPPTEMERRLLDAFASVRQQPRRSTMSRTWLAAAAAVLIVSAGGVWATATLTRTGRPGADDVRAAREFLDGFVFLPVAAGLPPLESGVIVRVEVPVSALPKYGVEVIADTSKTGIQADLLVGQDGQPRAIRFVTGEVSAGSSESRSRP